MIRLALITVLLAGALTAPASAGTFPGERPARAELRADADLAVAFWQARGVTGCPQGIEVLEADNLTGPDHPGRRPAGRGIDCRLWIDWQIAGEARHPTILRCAVTIHEVRHALGLVTGGIDGHGHTASGIMAPYAGGALADQPWPCRARARRPRARTTVHRPHHHRKGNRSWATGNLTNR